MCPFGTMVEAWRALELTAEERERQGRVHARGAYVWPEGDPGVALDKW